MRSLALFVAAALLELAGCFSLWAWLRQGRAAWILAPGLLSLISFAWCLAQVDSQHAGRAYAAYGGIYIAASLIWLCGVEGVVPDRWDVIGSVICVIGALVIVLGPHA